LIADILSETGLTGSRTEGVDPNGRTIFVADARRSDGRRFLVRADDKLTAFLELNRQLWQTSPLGVNLSEETNSLPTSKRARARRCSSLLGQFSDKFGHERISRHQLGV